VLKVRFDKLSFSSRAYTRAMTGFSLSLQSWQQRTFSSLKYPAFRLYWTSQILSLVGTWMQNTAQSYLVLELTGSSTALGWVNAVYFLPSLLFSLLAGALLDVLHKGKVLQATQGVLLLTALLTGVLIQTGFVSVPIIMVIALVSGTANAFNMPARQTMAATFVPREGLTNAVALNSLSFNLSRTVGQALFGLVVPLGIWLLAHGNGESLSRLALPFYLNAAAFVLAIFFQMKLPFPATRGEVSDHNLLRDTLEGLRYVRSQPRILYVIVLVCGVSTFLLNFQILIPTYAKQLYFLKESGFGMLSAVFGLGSTFGALYQASQHDPSRSLRSSALIVPLTLLVLPWMPNLVLSSAMLMVCGFFMMTLLISANSTVQLSLEESFRGRVMALYSMMIVGVAPIGALLAGVLLSSSEGFGPRWGTVALALLGAVCVGLVWRRLPGR